MIRFILVGISIAPATIWHGTRMIWSTWRKSPKADCICDDGPRKWAQLILRLSAAEVRLENEGIIDPDRPQILVANHQSWYDVLALLAGVPGRSVFVAKKELRKIPLFGPASAACGHIFIDRSDRTKAVQSLQEANQKLEEASPTIIMFPEGTRSKTGALGPFKKGAFVLAIQSGVDIVPAAISGSREIMEKGSFRIRAGSSIRVRFGEPIPVEGLGVEDRNQLTDLAWQAVEALKAELEATTPQ